MNKTELIEKYQIKHLAEFEQKLIYKSRRKQANGWDHKKELDEFIYQQSQKIDIYTEIINDLKAIK